MHAAASEREDPAIAQRGEMYRVGPAAQVQRLTGGEKLETEVLEALIEQLAAATPAAVAISTAAAAAADASSPADRAANGMPTQGQAVDRQVVERQSADGASAAPVDLEWQLQLGIEDEEEGCAAAATGEPEGELPPPPELTERDAARLRAGLAEVGPPWRDDCLAVRTGALVDPRFRACAPTPWCVCSCRYTLIGFRVVLHAYNPG